MTNEELKQQQEFYISHWEILLIGIDRASRPDVNIFQPLPMQPDSARILAAIERLTAAVIEVARRLPPPLDDER